MNNYISVSLSEILFRNELARGEAACAFGNAKTRCREAQVSE
jgi:hypothetical protein